MTHQHMVNSFDPAGVDQLAGPERELVRRREGSMGAAYRLFYERPIHVVRGEGALLYDRDGLDYLDAYNNVPVVGHSNERVRQAVSDQLARPNTHTRYLTTEVVAYAERLTALFPSPLDQVVFACTGSEAVDLALRVARTATGRSGVIVTRHAYHGTTTATAAISPSLGPNNHIPAEVALVDAPDPVNEDHATTAEEFGRRLDHAVVELQDRGVEPAAIVVDSIMSSDGLRPFPTDVLGVVAERAAKHGAVYVADEVQSGFGRTGRWWGFERHETSPDLVVLGKPMGNGIPISGVVGRPELFDAFGRAMRYFNTFGGNPVSVAAATAVLDELEDRNLLRHAESLGRTLLREIRDLAGGDRGAAQVRGAGLFIGVELVSEDGRPDPRRAADVVNLMRERRVLISASGIHDNVLKIRPPLVFPATAVPRLLDVLDGALRQTQ